MLYAHILEIPENRASKYVVAIREFYEFLDPDDQQTIAPLIRATLQEPGGDYGLLNQHINQWAARNKISIIGPQVVAKDIDCGVQTRITQLERRIAQMSALLMNWQDNANKEKSETETLDETECPAHERLERLQAIVHCAQQNGCKHIDRAIQEIEHGGKNGH